jgi:hypothetical protein
LYQEDGVHGDFLKCIEPDQLALLSALFAIAIADGLDPGESDVLGNFIVSVGSIILTISAQQDLLKGKTPAVG